MKITEIDIPKRKWTTLLSKADKAEVSDDLVGLVQGAYATTKHGSFVNSIKDVLPSDWDVFDWDDTPGIDSAIFYRKARGNEPWRGIKIQGLGHDGQRESKSQAVNHLISMLKKQGTWIEAGGAVQKVLLGKGVPAINDEKLLRKLFNDPSLRMIDDKTYTRTLENGTKITQSVFGKPTI